MHIKESIKIREEEGFFLLINLDENSILKGSPSFFKLNNSARKVVDFMRQDVDEYEVIDFCKRLDSCDEHISQIKEFISFLRKADLINE